MKNQNKPPLFYNRGYILMSVTLLLLLINMILELCVVTAQFDQRSAQAFSTFILRLPQKKVKTSIPVSNL